MERGKRGGVAHNERRGSRKKKMKKRGCRKSERRRRVTSFYQNLGSGQRRGAEPGDQAERLARACLGPQPPPPFVPVSHFRGTASPPLRQGRLLRRLEPLSPPPAPKRSWPPLTTPPPPGLGGQRKRKQSGWDAFFPGSRGDLPPCVMCVCVSTSHYVGTAVSVSTAPGSVSS